jgi:crossover junction endodeoxyribonuclease RuvC
MIILGIDPGFARVGWGILEVQSSKFKVQNCGCIETSKNAASQERLVDVYKQVCVLIKKYQPDSLAIEDLFFTNNAKTAFKVGEARGVIILAAAIQKIPVFSYTPLQVKIAVTGYGQADKIQVGRMVKAILKLKELPKLDDTVDAIAVALTHSFTKKY